MSKPPTPASPLEALKAGFRRACVRKLVGDEDGAVSVLRDEIPALVVGWAKSTSLEPSEKKTKLKELFDDESGRADELAVAFDLFAGRFETRVSDLVKKEVNGLANRMETTLQSLGSAVREFEELTQKLNVTQKVNKDLLSEIKSPPQQKISKVLNETEDLHPNHNKELTEEPLVDRDGKDPQKIEELSMADQSFTNITGKQQAQIVEEVLTHELDPPSGTGLRFDEIEEMIDEILSYEPN